MNQHELTIFMRAVEFAANKHKEQRRKNKTADPYINHPLQVAGLLTRAEISNYQALCAAVLHDTLEDTSTTMHELRREFGDNISYYVGEVTDDKSLPKVERKMKQIEHAPHMRYCSKLIKLADKLSNLWALKDDPPVTWSPEIVRGYAVWCLAVVNALRGTDDILEALLDLAFKRVDVDPEMSQAEIDAELCTYYAAIAKGDD